MVTVNRLGSVMQIPRRLSHHVPRYCTVLHTELNWTLNCISLSCTDQGTVLHCTLNCTAWHIEMYFTSQGTVFLCTPNCTSLHCTLNYIYCTILHNIMHCTALHTKHCYTFCKYSTLHTTLVIVILIEEKMSVWNCSLPELIQHKTAMNHPVQNADPWLRWVQKKRWLIGSKTR